jgi:predicted MFS family arabinose efflux permease
MLAAGLFGAGFAAFFQFAPLLFARRGGLPPEALYAVYGVGIIATRVVGGRLLDRLGIAQVVAMASGLMAAGLGLLAVATPPVGQIMAVLLVAAGSGLSHPALLAHHAALLPAEPGGASAAFYIGFDLGLGLGSALFGAALQLGGLGGLYGVAAALSAGALPLAPSLARQLRPTSSTVP